MKVECESFAEALQARFDGELAEEERESLEEHLEGCENCRRALDELSRLGEAFAEMSRRMKVSDGFDEGVVAGLPKKGGTQPVSRIVGGFEVLGKIGQGAMGAVYKARQISMDRVVALKILPLSLARDRTFADRFLREAKMAARVNHPNIIQGIDAGSFGRYYYIAMEYVDGPTVKQMIKERGRLDEKEAVGIALQVLSALEHAWKEGMVHRDVKPDNIMIASDGTTKLCDLGLAKPAAGGADVTQDGYIVGTPDYISPEQARGQSKLDVRADIYSLGATLYRMVTGNVPFDGSSPAEIMAKHLREPVPDPRKLVPVSAGLWSIIRRMMAKDRNERYQSPQEAASDLRALEDGTLAVTELPGEAPPVRTTRPRRRIERKPSRAYIFVLAAAAAVLVAAGIFFSRPKTQERPRKTRAQVPGPKGGSGEPSEAEAVYAHILAAYEKSPGDYEFHLARIDEHRGQLAGSPFAEKLAELRERIVNAREEEASRELARVRERADTFARQGDFAGASKVLRLPEPLMRTRAAAELASIRERMKERAEEAWNGLVSTVRGAVKAKEFDAARAALGSRPNLPGDRADELAELTALIDGAEAAERTRLGRLAAREARKRFEERTRTIVADFYARRFEEVKDACEKLASLEVSPEEKAVLRGYSALASDASGVYETALDALVAFSRSGKELSLGGGLSGGIKNVDRTNGEFALVKTIKAGGVAERRVGLGDLPAEDLVALAIEKLSQDAILAGELERGASKARRLSHVLSERGGTVARWRTALCAVSRDLGRARSECAKVRAAGDVLAALRDLLVREVRLAARDLRGEVDIAPDGMLELRYDFSSPAHLEDFQAHAGPTPGEGSWKIADGKLVSEGTAGLATRLEFTDFELRATYSVLKGDGVALGFASEGELDALVAGFAGRAYLEQWKGGLPRLLGEPREHATGSGGDIALARRGRELVAQTGGGELQASGVSDGRACVVLFPADGEIAFEEVVLRGRPALGGVR